MAWQSRFNDFAQYDDTNNNNNQNNTGFSNRTSSNYQTNNNGRRGQSGPAGAGGSGRGAQQQQRSNDFFGSESSKYCRICDLSNESTSSILGVIISKEGPRSFVSKKGTGSERNLISFTIRDDISAFINLTCWGGPEFATRLSDNFRIGDVVELKGAQVQAKSKNPSDDKFKPWTPSAFCLNLSENHGEFNFYHGPETEFLSSLVSVPTRESNDFYTLEDIQANGMNLQSEHINIFALVKKVWPLREIVTKTGKKTAKVDVVLCDETCPAFNLTLWDSFASLIEYWKPLETVVFAADVRVSHSDYHSSMVACTDSKTMFTVDPDTAEAQALSEFGRSQASNVLDMETGLVVGEGARDPDVDSITNIMTIKEVKILQGDLLSSTGQNGYGVLYAFLTHFDIDAENKSIVKHICPKCRKSVQNNTDYMCTTQGCCALPSDGLPLLEYSVSVTLTDATGSLETCFVVPLAMEKFINLPGSEFQNVNDRMRTQLKWQYLFERMKAVVKFSGNMLPGKSGKSFVRVMSIDKALPTEVLERCYATL